MADEIEGVRRAAFKRIVEADILKADAVQLENEPAPNVLPYCRITVSNSAEYNFTSQRTMDQLVILNFDLFGQAQSDTRELSALAEAIDREFGKYSRDASKRMIEIPETENASGVVEKYGRGTGQTEADRGLYRIPVLLYVRLTLEVS